IFRHEKSDMFDIMRAIMELSRGHGESAMKSKRLGDKWDDKRAKLGERKLTARCPFWLKLNETRDGFIVKAETAELVRRIFRLAIGGRGAATIARQLNAEAIPSPSGRLWNGVSVLFILNSRAVFGEFTPRRVRGGKRENATPPIADYYPAIL